MANLIPNLRQQFFDNNGDPLAGGKLFSYIAATSTPLETFTDATGLVPNTNPVILNANGEADVWIGQSAYKFVLTDAADVEIKTVDNVVLIDALSVTTAKMADLSVTTAKLNNLSVTTAKLENLSVTTAKLANSAVTTAKLNDLSVTTAKLADESITPSKLSDLIYSEVYTERNKIINGDMEIWQRGLVKSSIVHKGFGADRWRYSKVGTMVHDILRENSIKPTFVESGLVFNNSMRIVCITADTSVAVGDYTEISQAIEGSFIRDLLFKEFVVSFWIRSSKTGRLCLSLKNKPTFSFLLPTKSYVAEFTIDAVNTWEKKVVAVPAFTNGVWLSGPDTGIYVSIVLTAGSTFHTTKDAWQDGNYSGTAAMGNFCDSNTNQIYLTGFRLEGGSIPRQYESRSPAIEQLMCNRYCEIVHANFLAYNPNVAATGVFGGEVPYTTSKEAGFIVLYDSFTNVNTRCSAPTITAGFNGAKFVSNFTSGSAGAAEFDSFAIVESELET